MRTVLSVLFTLLLFCFGADAAQYWVATNGNNSNPGTQALPWLTIAHAVSIANTNDTVRVEPGNYYEAVIPSHSGSPGTNITFVGIGYPVTCGFRLSGLSNWRIIGFHFAMTNASQVVDCISIAKCTNILIQDNWFDHVSCTHAPIVAASSPSPSPGAYCITIRSNFFDHPGGSSFNTSFEPENSLMGYGLTNLLFEYNKIQTAINMIYLMGFSNVVRNNYFFDMQQSYFDPNLPHIDTLQSDGDGIGQYAGTNSLTGGAYHILLENNVTISNYTIGGSKFVIAQEPATNASVQSISDFIIRKNVTLYIGSYIYLFDDVYNMRTYNNTFAYPCGGFTNPTYAIEASTNYEKTGAILPTNIVVINNNFYGVNENNANGTVFIQIGTISKNPPYNDIFAHNLSYLSGPAIYQSSGGDIIGSDPKFLSFSNLDTHLTGPSPGISASMPETTTTASGTSTTIVPVVDVGYFQDGWGMTNMGVEPDVVEVGNNPGVPIASIDYVGNTITLASPITFNSGDGVFLDGTQDIGAYKYDLNGYTYGINITSPQSYTTANGQTTITAAVTNPSKVRIVRFYVDGLEVGSAPPAPVVSINTLITGTNNIIQARAYSLFAETNLALSSTIALNSLPPLAAPTSLRIVTP